MQQTYPVPQSATRFQQIGVFSSADDTSFWVAVPDGNQVSFNVHRLDTQTGAVLQTLNIEEDPWDTALFRQVSGVSITRIAIPPEQQ